MNTSEDKKGESVEKWLTMSLLVAFLLNIKKVLIPNVLVEGSLFNEHLDLSVYLFDGVFLLWLGYIILKHEYLLLSIYKKMFHVEQSGNADQQRMFHVEHTLKSITLLILAFILWQWLSVTQADQIPLAIRSALTMTEIGVFISIQLIRMFHVEQQVASNNVPRGTQDVLYRSIIKIMTYFALFNAFVVFIQVSTQHSIGLKYLGESFLRVGNPGIATINLFGEKILRGYGLFPHPNILAAFLGLTLLVLLIHQNVPRGTISSVETKNSSKTMFHVEHLVIGTLVMALMLTFSRTGILLTLLGSIFIVPRGTFPRFPLKKKIQLFHVEHWLMALAVILLVTLGGLTSLKSFSERELSLVEYSELSHFQLIGNGVASYGARLYSQIYSVNDWSIQPIHNYFLLTYYELGAIGLFLIIFLLVKVITEKKNDTMFHVEQLEGNHEKEMFHVEHSKEYLAVVFFLIVFALGDHFFYTIPQGQAIFWLGILVALKERG